MNLGEMYTLIEFIVNKDYDGNIITPERFKMLIKVVNIEHFRDKYGLPEEYQPGRPIPNERADITLKNIDDMKAFKEMMPNRTVAAGVMLYPSGYVHRDAITYNFSKTINGTPTSLPRPVEVLRGSEFASREGNYTKRPTLQNPICTFRSDGVHVRPITITAVDFSYFRFPTTPIFAYIESDGYITYDAVNSIELEWPEDEKIVIMRRCLEYIGVNLREADITNYANVKLKGG